MFPEFMKNLFIECSDTTTRAGYTITSVSSCRIMYPIQIIENCFLLSFGVVMSVILYQLCMTIVSWIFPVFKWCFLKVDLTKEPSLGTICSGLDKVLPFDVSKLFYNKQPLKHWLQHRLSTHLHYIFTDTRCLNITGGVLWSEAKLLHFHILFY